jgi:spore germination cell wall hydrolase CwlJ-like protein
MVRNARPKGVFSAPFGLSFLVFAIMPSAIGHQDLAALMARQPAVTEHWRQHIRASAFGTIHAATFSFSRPVGTAVPRPLSHQLASLDPRLVTLGPWYGRADADDPPLPFPKVDRSAKGDREPVLHPPRRPAVTTPEEMPAVAAPAGEPVALKDEQFGAKSELGEAAENPAEDVPDPLELTAAENPGSTPAEAINPMLEMARLYFGDEPLGDPPGVLEKWAPGEEPTIVEPNAPPDRDLKQSALDPKQAPAEATSGETIAPKGEVTGEGKRPSTPAERLKLEGSARSKAEKCLADAVYFEARGEPVRGQIAVAQVVMNRVFSGYYPRNVCGAVYQNAHRRLACQFTFACDGIPNTVTEPQAWVRATRIARDVLDGKYWLPEVDRATHYHAYWVRPRWVREMKRLYKFGVHTFYRPRKWGDGHDTPSWGTLAATNEAIAKL